MSNGPLYPPSGLRPPNQPMRSTGDVAARPMNDRIGVGSTSNPERLRLLGSEMSGRGAFQNNMGQSNEARGHQMNALGLTQGAATGAAPSRAELLGKTMVADSLNAQLAGAASARGGPMAQAAAMRGAATNAAAMQQRGTADAMAMRADEMARARDAYAAQAGAMRSADLGAAGMQAENERFQRGLNQQGQLATEGMALDQEKAQAGILLGQQQDDSANYRAQIAEDAANYRNRSQVNQHSTDRSTGVGTAIAGGVLGAAGAALGFLSDPSAKTNVHALSQPMGTHEPWMPAREDVDFIKYGGNADPSALDARYAQHANPPAPWLDQYMAPPQQQPMTKGVAGAPEGYAASRMGQPGSMFAPPADEGPGDGAMAPGTADWNRYGAGAATSGAPDWAKGGATPATATGVAGAGLGAMGTQLKDFRVPSMPYTEKSDERSKRKLEPMSAPMKGKDVLPLYEPPGKQLHQDFDGRAFFRDEAPEDDGRPRIAGSRGGESTTKGSRSSSSSSARAAKLARPMTPDELRRAADELEHSMRSDHEARMAQGPAVDPREAAPAQMMDAVGGGKTFQYRAGVPGEDPARQHFGTTTSDLKRTPMGASMVVPGSPETGGYEAIDVREAVGPTIASLGNLNQRLRLLERDRGKGGR